MAAFMWLTPAPGHAQKVQPGDERPELPEFEPEPQAPALRLPSIEREPIDERERLATTGRVFVNQIHVAGSTVFSDAELAAVTEPWTGRPLTSEDLIAVRDAVTGYYVEAGYLTSGAILPDQTIDGGVVTLLVVEGHLVNVHVEGTERFRPGYFKRRLLRMGGALNVRTLERELQILQQDDRVASLNATLQPGATLGQSVLLVEVEETLPYRAALTLSNEQSPFIGSDGGQIGGSFENPLGFGDRLYGSFWRTEGLKDLELGYMIPVTPYDTTISLDYRWSESEVITSEFDSLDFESDFVSYGITLRQPLYRTPLQEVAIGLVGEWRQSTTYIFEDEKISLAPGADDGETTVSVLRFFQEWTRRSRNDAIAARSMLSLGIDALGSSDESGQPDSRYVAWLGQVQWAHRFSERFWRTELLTRFDIQLADDRLLTLEKFEVGGLRTVRGYHENELVRDNGYAGSIELRVPIWNDGGGRPILQIAPFYDIGRSWDKNGRIDGGRESPKTIPSVGVGLRMAPTPNVLGEVYWGEALRDVSDRGSGIQNDGWHIRFTARTF
jgi:hemolysin activation/secretion protein